MTESQGVLNEHFGRIQNSLLAKAAEAGILRHPTSKGTARELLVSEFLEASLPREFDFVSGEIISPSGDRSGQLDVMMLPHTAPRFRLAPRISLGLVHAVAAVIEVKSNLTNAELDNALAMAKKVRDLRIDPPHDPWPWSGTKTTDNSTVRLEDMPVCIVAFDGPKAETLFERLNTISPGRPLLPNAITCLSRNYTVLRNDGWIFPADPPNRMLTGQGGALATLFDVLMKVAQAWAYARPRTPLGSYLEPAFPKEHSE